MPVDTRQRSGFVVAEGDGYVVTRDATLTPEPARESAPGASEAGAREGRFTLGGEGDEA